MRRGLPGEERLLEWAHRRAFESRLRPRLHTLETAVPYGGCALVYCLLGFLVLRAGTRGPALRAMAAGVVAWIVSDVLKLLVERPRPCLHQLSCGTHSFPEGPGMVLAAVAVAIWPRSRPIAVVAVACAARMRPSSSATAATGRATCSEPGCSADCADSPFRAWPPLAHARGNSPWRDGVSWVRCTFLSWSPK